MSSYIPKAIFLNGMEITINEIKTTVEAGTVLQDIVVQQFGDKLNGIAAAINQQVIPKSSWGSQEIVENDAILLIKATQGG